MIELEWVTDLRANEHRERRVLLLLHIMGACRDHDPNIFHPLKGESASKAKAICSTCPVRISCREYGLRSYEQIGIWGGLTPRERKRERARRGMRRDDVAA